jgi:hypothetical protein
MHEIHQPDQSDNEWHDDGGTERPAVAHALLLAEFVEQGTRRVAGRQFRMKRLARANRHNQRESSGGRFEPRIGRPRPRTDAAVNLSSRDGITERSRSPLVARTDSSCPRPHRTLQCQVSRHVPLTGTPHSPAPRDSWSTSSSPGLPYLAASLASHRATPAFWPRPLDIRKHPRLLATGPECLAREPGV